MLEITFNRNDILQANVNALELSVKEQEKLKTGFIGDLSKVNARVTKLEEEVSNSTPAFGTADERVKLEKVLAMARN